MPRPSPAPTGGLYAHGQLETMMLVSELASIFLRTAIGALCAWRLVDYRSRGLARCGEIKTVFHFTMLLTLFFSLPYFVDCGVHFKDAYCNVPPSSTDGFRLNVALYAFYRVGLCLQVLCLSLTVLNWADFLHGGKYVGEVFYFERTRSGVLRFGLLALNLSILGVNIACSAILAFHASESRGDLTYIAWIAFSAVELIMVVFLLWYGSRLLSRIHEATAFDSANRQLMVRRLVGVVFVMCLVLVVEIAARWILAMPLYVDGWDSMHPKPYIYMLLSQNPVLWQLCAYVLPCDVLSFAMLYLMRTPPRKRPSQPDSLLAPKPAGLPVEGEARIDPGGVDPGGFGGSGYDDYYEEYLSDDEDFARPGASVPGAVAAADAEAVAEGGYVPMSGPAESDD